SYHITEPHPSVPASHYFHTGRGGAGNYHHVDPKHITHSTTATGPASRVKLTPPPPNAIFMAGRGGAGNAHPQKERAIFSFDEELEQQKLITEHSAPVYHIGRGGAGNAVDEVHPHRHGSTSSSASSAGSHHGKARHSLEGAWNRVSRSLS
ncbi:hypothetical protein BDY21DRAFT_270150, partial [Lineolata rhizophorae]